MKKLNQMRMANDQQLKQIHGTDYAYTETVVIYLRGALRKNPYAVEHAISDLLTTLIDAQTAGRKVSTFFGDDPETAADNILKELPPAPLDYFVSLFWPFAMFPLIDGILMMVVDHETRLLLTDFFPMLIVSLGLFGISFGRGISFNRLSRKTIRRVLISLFLIFGLPLLIGYVSNHVFNLSFSSTTLIPICGGFVFLNLGLAACFRKNALLFLGWSAIWAFTAATLFLPISELSVGLAFVGLGACLLLLFYRPESQSHLEVS